MRDRGQPVDVDVRLVKAIEQHQAVNACVVHSVGEVAEGREKRRQFHGNRDHQGGFEFCYHVANTPLDGKSRDVGLRDDVVLDAACI